MIFLIASSSKCIEIESDNLQFAMDRGMKLLDQDEKYGNVGGCEKPPTMEGLKELRRNLIIQTGEFLEYFGYPDHECKQILSYVNALLNGMVPLL